VFVGFCNCKVSYVILISCPKRLLNIYRISVTLGVSHKIGSDLATLKHVRISVTLDVSHKIGSDLATLKHVRISVTLDVSHKIGSDFITDMDLIIFVVHSESFLQLNIG